MDGSEEEGPGGSDTRGGGDLEESVRIVSGASVSVPNLGPETGRQTVAPSLVFLPLHNYVATLLWKTLGWWGLGFEQGVGKVRGKGFGRSHADLGCFM